MIQHVKSGKKKNSIYYFQYYIGDEKPPTAVKRNWKATRQLPSQGMGSGLK